MDGVTIEGLDEVIDSIEKFTQKYPDKAGDFLRKQAMETRKGIAKEARAAVDVDTSNKYSLGKAGNYNVSQVMGYGAGQYVELSAKSPHFHLIEHGHQLVSHSGKPIGWVPGYKIMDAEAKRQSVKVPINFGKMVDDFLKEVDLE